MSQYGVKPGGEERLVQILEQFGKIAYESFMSTKAIYFGFVEQENLLCCLLFTNNRYI
jgi:hypothetical protein